MTGKDKTLITLELRGLRVVAAKAGPISYTTLVAWSPKQPRSLMLRQELGHGGFIAGVNPAERVPPGGSRQAAARTGVTEATLWRRRMGSVDGWPMATPETQQQEIPTR